MSLIDAMMTECCFMNKSKVSDGEGGTITAWTDGATFNASVIIQNSALAKIADALKETKTYQVTVKKDTNLEYGDVIKRLSDGATFKITSETMDQTVPSISTLDIAQATAERWDLTS